MPGRTIFDHHDVTDEDIAAASYGDDFHYWSDVAAADNRIIDRTVASQAAQERRLLNDLTAAEYASVHRSGWKDLADLREAVDRLRKPGAREQS